MKLVAKGEKTVAATIRDVAKLAGVSPSTVSRVLNNKGVISEDTSQRIKKAMRELNYIPNDSARSFATGSSRTIALVIDVEKPAAYSNVFFNDTVFGIETIAYKNGYSLMVTNGISAREDGASIEHLVLGKKIDGIIIPSSIASDQLLEKLTAMEFPCVILGYNENPMSEISWVDINNVQAGALAVRHLYQHGYRRIACLMDGEKEIFSRDRITGYRRELEACGLPYAAELIQQQLSTLEAGKSCVRNMLNTGEPPDAVICGNDRLALGALRAARQEKIQVPKEFGILSFDDTVLTEFAEPSITSLDVSTYELGVQAAEILIGQIEAPSTNSKQVLIQTKIITRDSTMKEK